MYHRSIILILTILEVGVQPCTLTGWLWFPRRISMDTGGGHLKYMAAHFCSLIPDLPTHFSVPITSCCGCLWMAPCHSCLIFPGCHCTSADDTDANLNRRHGAVVEWRWWWWWGGGGRMWKEMWKVISSRIGPGCLAALHHNVSIWFYPWNEAQGNQEVVFKKTHLSTMTVLAQLPSYTLTGVSHLNFRV